MAKKDCALHVWGSALALRANLAVALAAKAEPYFEVPRVELEINGAIAAGAISISGGRVAAVAAPGFGIEISTAAKRHYKLVPGSGYRWPATAGGRRG